jgi:tetratricopeptide (TPR) repeat protein
MPSRVYRDPLSVEIDLLEAVPTTPGSSRQHLQSYPFPALHLSGEKRTIEFPCVVLENDSVRYAFLPELGGRLLGLFDKRSGQDILPLSPTLSISAGGPRGASLNAGLELLVGNRLNRLGPVEVQVAEPEDEEEPAGLCFAELVSGSSLSYHIFFHLPPDSVVLTAEVRVLNRGLLPAPYSAGLQLHSPQFRSASPTSSVAYDTERDCGIGVGYETEELYQVSEKSLERSGESRELLPGQLDVCRFALTPFSKLGGIPAIGSGAAVFLGKASEGQEEVVRVQAFRSALGAKLVLQTPQGALEAPLDLYPEQLFVASTEGTGATAAVLLDAERRELCRWEERADIPTPNTYFRSPSSAEEAYRAGVHRFQSGDQPIAECKRAALDLGWKGPAYRLLGFAHLSAGEFERAAESFENALLFNAEDHLCWWAKAMSHRLAGDEEDRGELPNAHFLAPLEPLLRAEGFLAQNSQERAANPLIRPIADNPDAMIEIGCWLYELRLYEQLSKWVDEAIRHREIPMLRYLLADALLKQSRMTVEAAEHVRAAGAAPINPPYPWRSTELAVLRSLNQRFPEDARIRDLQSLAEWAGV